MYNNKNLIKLHIGCGHVILDGWNNIDKDHPDADIQLDVTCGLPYPDNSVGYIFAEHFIEHITRPQALIFLRECRRVLVEGGLIRLATPNLDALVDAYLARDTGRWGDLWQPNSPCQLLNEGFHNWGHKYIYNRSDMYLLLKEAGFEDRNFVGHRKSIFPTLANLEVRPFFNDIIIEAAKDT
jgi:predicted SAM-dependent methyltransferase